MKDAARSDPGDEMHQTMTEHLEQAMNEVRNADPEHRHDLAALGLILTSTSTKALRWEIREYATAARKSNGRIRAAADTVLQLAWKDLNYIRVLRNELRGYLTKEAA
jgi:hypothetical protein